ncbi:hypothetical protein DSO57_1038652 [Entomophthora muscae]|uniref:Uncharacterized protein n=1 Tax=Entomophthora muscae TaxID=34485 RepID=A0ACC2SZG3_9FUNG|nr:hypothetical protein DSO57_1038652 [Entomophthora muscae]
MKDTTLMIICQGKNMIQTGTVKELKRAYKEVFLCTSSDMTFNNPATHLMYYNTIKAHVVRNDNFSYPKPKGSNPEPNLLWSASSEGQELSCLHPINSEPERKVDANLPGLKSLLTSHGFVNNLPMPESKSFPEVIACNTGSLGGEISNPANEKSPKPAHSLRLDTCTANPSNTIAYKDKLTASDTMSFPKIPTCDIGRSGRKITKSVNENCPNLPKAQKMALALNTHPTPNINF